MKITMYSYFSDLVRQKGIEEAADIACSFGCEAVEFIDVYERPSVIKDEDTAREYRRVLEEKGLKVACYSVAIHVVSPESDGLDETDAERYLMHSAKMAAAVGSPFLHHTLVLTYKYNENSYVRDFESVKKSLLPHTCAVADLCNSLGLTVLYEPQGVYVNGRENFTSFYSEMKRLGKKVGVCGDMGNSLFCDWLPEEFFEEFASEIKHIHAKDYKLTDDTEARGYTSMSKKRLVPVLFGEGDVDIARCLSAVRAKGYDGAISLEGEYHDVYKEIPLDVAALKRFVLL